MHRPNCILPAELIMDNRGIEVRELIKGYPSNSYVVVSKQVIFILVDNAMLYKTELFTTPEDWNFDMAFMISNLNGVDERYLIRDTAVFDFVMDKVYRTLDYNSTDPKLLIAREEELRGNVQYEQLLAKKSFEGMNFFRLPRLDIPGQSVFIPTWTGFPKLNKNDKIGIEVYRNPQENNLLVKYKIYKANIHRDVYLWFRVLNI
jgi:hypothetical protein